MRIGLVALLLLCWTIPPSAKAATGTAIPFTYRDGMIWLKVRVAGQTEAAHFLLDSGAGTSVVDLEAARRLRLKIGRRETVQGVRGSCAAYRVEGMEAEVSGVSLAGTMLATDLAEISASCGCRVDGLIGLDFFYGRVVQIDFAARQIRLLSRGEALEDRAQILPLALRHDALCLPVGINGQPRQWMRLDTGCSSAIEWAPGRGVALPGNARHAIRADLTLGTEMLPGVRAGLHGEPLFAGEAGLVGNGLLSQYRVTVDAGRSRVILDRVN